MERITFKTADGKTYHLEIDHLNPNILTAGSTGRIRKVSGYLEKVETVEGERGLVVVSGDYKGLKISAFSTGIGPASTAVVLPEAFEVTKGPITMLRLGTCGSLQSFVEPGHLVVSSAAVRDEMATRAAIGPEYPAVANPELIPILIAGAEKHGYGLGEKLWVGVTHTKDDLYFTETPHFSPSRELVEAKLKSYRRMGVLASEMEFSVYCVMRDFYEGRREDRILVGALLAVLASAPEHGAVDVSRINRQAKDRDLIEIGLDTLLMTNRMREGKTIDEDLGRIVQKLVQLPSQKRP